MLICRLCECEIRSFEAFECISIFGFGVLMSEFVSVRKCIAIV